MKHIAFFAVLMIIAASGCRPMYQAGSAPSAKSDKMRLPDLAAPVTYDTKASAAASSNPYQKHLDYVDHFKLAAVAEMERSGVPASIKLAQGLLESNAGQSELAVEANNHFGIKCPGGWNGKTFYQKDDDRGDDGEIVESCFRRYDRVEDCFYDHTQFLRDPKKQNRYGFLFNLDRTDYKGWAEGLQSAGYATNPQYADKLIEIIERYQLYKYDRSDGIDVDRPTNDDTPTTGSGNKPNTGTVNRPGGSGGSSANSRVGSVNGVKVVVTRSDGETLEAISRSFRKKVSDIVGYNDYAYTPGQKLPANTRVYMEEKKASLKNSQTTFHFVRDNQRMVDIAQLYGIRLDDLLSRNHLRRGQEPANGEKIRLRGRAGRKEVVNLRDTSSDPAPVDSTPDTPRPTRPTNTSQEPVEPDEEDELFELPGGGEENEENDWDNKPSRPSTTRPDPDEDVIIGKEKPTNKPSKPPIPDEEEEEEEAVIPGARYHTVAKGDTLYNLSRRYNSDVDTLKRLNKMKNDQIKIGQKLRVK